MAHNFISVGKRHVEETRSISRNLIEKAMYMRCLSYLAEVKASLLTQTIFEIDKSKKDLSTLNRKLKQSQNSLARQVEEQTKELSESEEYYRILADESPVGVYLVQDSFFQYVNQAFLNIFGYAADEVIGRMSPLDMLTEESRPIMSEEMRKRFAGEAASLQGNTYQGYTKQGKIVDFEIHGTRTSHNGRSALVGTLLDITERKRAETLLKQRELQQVVVSELGLDALTGLELDTLLQKITDRLAETLNLECCKVLELQPNGKALLLRAGIGWKEGLVGHATVGSELGSQAGYTLKSDHPVIVRDLCAETRFNGPPLLHDHGVVSGVSVLIQGTDRPWGILGVHTKEHREFSEDDVHFIQSIANVLALAIDRKRYEEGLHQFEHIVSTSTDMLALLDKDFIYRSANPAYLVAFNKTYGDVVGHTAQEVFGKKFFNEVVRPNVKRCLAGEEVNYQEWCDFPAYGPRFMDIYYYPYISADNEVVGFVVNGRNITEHKKAEEEQEQLLGKMKGLSRKLLKLREEERQQLARTLHDDIGQSLTVIQSYSASIIGHCEKRNLHQAITAAKEVKDISVHLLQTVRDQLRDLSPGYVNELGLKGAVQNLCDIWERSNAFSCRIKISDKVDDFPGDLQVQVFRIVQEALTNVAKHAEASVTKVTLRLGKGGLDIDITDDGHGFDTAASTQGMGLVGIRERALAIGGELQLQSSPEKGTQIHIRLPLAIKQVWLASESK